MLRTLILSLATGVLLAAPPAVSGKPKPAHSAAAAKASTESPLTRLADPQVIQGKFVWFSVDATMPVIAKRLGPPARTSGSELYATWEYFIGETDHDPSHTILFRRSDQKIVSVTRAFEHGQNVDAWFPEGSTKVVHWPDAERPQLSARVRILPGAAVLIAIGSSKPGERTNQLVLVRREAVSIFFQWLEPFLPAP